ncbi:MAG: homoserine dehydrogenase [Desulfobacterales bacterium]|nr:homoserine dehydrogenase [Desulfobacterales bacterium]
MKTIKVGLLGCGTVGTGVAKMLIENADIITKRVGANIILSKIADIDKNKDRGINFGEGVFISDSYKVVNDPEIDIIVELIGGETIAKDLILLAIENGKHIVTANKALLANQGDEIFSACEKKNIDIAYEASVAGCIPIIKTIRESLAGNQIKSMTGILNGTCNYILSKITNDNISYMDALSQAQAKGYAEANSFLDVEGYDAAHKLAILTTLSYGTKINVKDIYTEGISKISPLDIEFAEQFGYKVKLLAISKNWGDSIEARVHPTMIPFENLLSNVNDSLNAVTISGDRSGDIMLYGYGAGMMPTASAVVGDIIDIARNIMLGSKGRIPLLSFKMENIKTIPIKPVDEVFTYYYFRFSAVDRPGVLSKISGILGTYGISIKSVQQKYRKSKGMVPVIMFTYKAKEADVKKALSEIYHTDIINDYPILIRIEEIDDEN